MFIKYEPGKYVDVNSITLLDTTQGVNFKIRGSMLFLHVDKELQFNFLKQVSNATNSHVELL